MTCFTALYSGAELSHDEVTDQLAWAIIDRRCQPRRRGRQRQLFHSLLPGARRWHCRPEQPYDINDCPTIDEVQLNRVWAGPGTDVGDA